MIIEKLKEAPYLSCMDDNMSEIEVDFFLSDLTDLLKEVNPNGYFYGVVENFGWRLRDGHCFLELHEGRDIFSKVLPKTDCHFHVFKEGNIIKIQNYHHDSPMGKEWYMLIPITKKQFENEQKPKL